MTAPDVRTAARRDCVNCGNSYEPTDTNQRFCRNLCKRQNYHLRRYGKEQADYWLKRQLAKREPAPAAYVTPTREQIARAMWESTPTPDRPWEMAPEQVRQAGYELADAVVAVIKESQRL